MTAVQKLRSMLADPAKLIVCPGVYDGFTARLALAEGAECLYMTGAGTAMSRLGLADLGVATLNDMRDNAAMIASLSPSTPLIADADTGYGSAIQVRRTVALYLRAGVAGLHLEDQVVSKRCGHLAGKQVVAADEYASRIRAAVLAREQCGADIVVIARTDALQRFGYDEALGRLRAAVAAGADVAFLEAVVSIEQAKRFVLDMAPTPCLFNNVAGGASPDLSVREARECGFRIAIYPTIGLEAVYRAVRGAYRGLLDEGVVGGVHGHGNGTDDVDRESERVAVRELFEVCGLDEAMRFDRDVGGGAWDGV